MGCTCSRDVGGTAVVRDRPTRAKRSRGRGSISDISLVRELFDEDVHDVYDFTGPVLGSGAFATVLRVRDKMSGVEYAIKQIDLSGIKDDPSAMRMLYNEIDGMKALSHPNIVRLQEVYQPKNEDMLYLVLDRLEGGSVDALRKREGRIEEGHAAYIIAQVVDAVRYCHSLHIAHRDLKLANCMFEDNSLAPIVKVIDFGLCTEFKDGKTSSAFVGTMTYAAPEMIARNKSHGIECDMWSVGVMAFVLVGGRLPFYADDEGALQQQIKFAQHAYTDNAWKGVSALCRDFIDKCLNKNPKKRITAKQAQVHPWIKKAVKAMEGAPLSKEAMLSMMKFQETNLFEKIAMELVAYSYEPAQIKDLERHFREMDAEGTGVLSLSDFKAAIMERRRAIVQRQQEKIASTQAPNGGGTGPVTSGAGQDCTEETSDKEPKREGGERGKEGGVLEVVQERKGNGKDEVAEGGGVVVSTSSVVVEGPTTAKRGAAKEREERRAELAVAPGQKRPSLTMGEVGHIVRTLSSQGLIGDRSTSDSFSPSSSNHARRLYGRQSTTGSVGGSVIGRLDEEGVERIFEAIDVDGTGTLDITEFVAACLVKRQINDAAIKAAFNRLDYSRTGLISAEDMGMYLGDTFDESKMQIYMGEISSRSDGLVTLDDFSKCLKAHVLRFRLSSRGNSRRTTTDSLGSRRLSSESDRLNISDQSKSKGQPKDDDRPGGIDPQKYTDRPADSDGPSTTVQPSPAKKSEKDGPGPEAGRDLTEAERAHEV